MKIEKTLQQVLSASRKLNLVEEETINKVLLELADEAEKNIPFIIEENRKDLERMDAGDPKYDRLELTASRIRGIASDIRNVAALNSPVGKVLKENIRPNGLRIKKVTVPFGVIGIIYEARPNVTFDVFSLCLKSGNACVLKGGAMPSIPIQPSFPLFAMYLKRIISMRIRLHCCLPDAKKPTKCCVHADTLT